MTLGSVSRERWILLEPLLDAALELEPADRAAFLDDKCGQGTVLRAQLLALLEACDHADNMLGAPAALAFGPLLIEPTPELPSLLGGRYRIVREIGRGGMATVHLADDPKHGRQVAVKVLHTDVARLIGRERFLREIEIAAGLSHPHILPLHDSGEAPCNRTDEPSFLYYVSPFVAGESLRDRLLREPKLSTEEIVRLGREIAQALDYAHRQGVIHLDVKPGNILLQDGHAVIADFGIARAMSRANEQSTHDTMPLLGTPSYMSPEQALGAEDVDGRSDVYSLGCVLYEMITGKRPFAQTTPGEAAARARAPQPPNRATLLQHASTDLAAVIMRATAPSRDERFRTAGELALALSEATREKTVSGWRRRRVIVGSVVALVVASVGAVWTSRNGAALDSNLIVVAPFDVEAPTIALSTLSLWKEGLVDVMSRNLDGAGALRAVPSTIVVRRWRGRADAQSARALGEKTGARLVLFGGLLAFGDSVRATASLLDAHTGRTLAEFEQRDVAERIDRVSDSLTVDVLRELGRTRRIDMARATSSPTSSLAALKAYLQGEQFYRAAQWDSAQTRFARAIELDTTFTLAYHRLANVRKWLDPREIPDSSTYELMRRTIHFTNGMAPHEHLLAVIDSLSAEAYFAWRRGLMDAHGFDDEQRIARELYATVNAGMRRYPNDAELSLLYAESRFRFDPDVVTGELDDRGILSAYDHAIALDSSFAPAYLKPISLAAYLDGAASARRYTQAYLALDPSGSHAQAIRLADLLLDPARQASLDVPRLVDTLPADRLCEAATLLRHIPDSSETLVRTARALALHSTQPSTSPRPNCALMEAMNGMQFRGHLREALQMTALQAHGLRSTVMYNMARFNMVPAEESRAEFRYVLSLAPRSTMAKLYGWWSTDGDTSAIQLYINNFTRILNTRHIESTNEGLRADIAGGNAYLALARRDTASALHQFLTTPDTLHECWGDNRITTVKLLIAQGRTAEAGARLERRWPGTSSCNNGFDDVVWTMDRARVFERLGRRVEAAADYAFVAAAWRNADPELQLYVREARTAATRLTLALKH